jgi:hypothetical protein
VIGPGGVGVTTFQVTFDCADPGRPAAFWGESLGYVPQEPPDGSGSWEDWARAKGIPEERWNDADARVDPCGAGPRPFFQRVPEPKNAKNRVHLDVNAGAALEGERRRDRVRTEAERATALGAAEIAVLDERSGFWIVMREPEGNEFCPQ